ncbi:MAG: hypothetical protein GTN93_13200, partial [Anaerolineae bacterium]|nr:hypothetical protein [Anaerolineae bacterium]
METVKGARYKGAEIMRQAVDETKRVSKLLFKTRNMTKQEAQRQAFTVNLDDVRAGLKGTPSEGFETLSTAGSIKMARSTADPRTFVVTDYQGKSKFLQKLSPVKETVEAGELRLSSAEGEIAISQLTPGTNAGTQWALIDESRVVPTLRKKGFGSQLYLRALSVADREGFAGLVSHDASPAARALQDSLERRGLVLIKQVDELTRELKITPKGKKAAAFELKSNERKALEELYLRSIADAEQRGGERILSGVTSTEEAEILSSLERQGKIYLTRMSEGGFEIRTARALKEVPSGKPIPKGSKNPEKDVVGNTPVPTPASVTFNEEKVRMAKEFAANIKKQGIVESEMAKDTANRITQKMALAFRMGELSLEEVIEIQAKWNLDPIMLASEVTQTVSASARIMNQMSQLAKIWGTKAQTNPFVLALQEHSK